MYWLYMVNRGCLWEMELDIMAASGNSWVFILDELDIMAGCIWEMVDVFGRWKKI